MIILCFVQPGGHEARSIGPRAGVYIVIDTIHPPFSLRICVCYLALGPNCP